MSVAAERWYDPVRGRGRSSGFEATSRPPAIYVCDQRARLALIGAHHHNAVAARIGRDPVRQAHTSKANV